MFLYTDTADAPWTVVKSNDKKRARVEAMRHVLARFDYDDKDPEVVGTARPADRRHGRRSAGGRRGSGQLRLLEVGPHIDQGDQRQFLADLFNDAEGDLGVGQVTCSETWPHPTTVCDGSPPPGPHSERAAG